MSGCRHNEAVSAAKPPTLLQKLAGTHLPANAADVVKGLTAIK